MVISVGDPLPEGTFTQLTGAGLETILVSDLTKGKSIALFGLPGAFTNTCSAAHLPSFMRTAQALKAKGVDRVVCLSVNDPFVMDAWDKSTGASETGVEMWVDADGSFTKSIGLGFSVPQRGFIDRSLRYSALIENGVLKILNREEKSGVCELSAGETLLAQI